MTNYKKGRIIIENIILKPLRQKKGRAGLSERVEYGVSSIKALCVIWTVEGSVKCTDVRLA